MSACAVAWCVWDACEGDHFADPGGDAWPATVPTAAGELTTIAAAPTWGETDGLAPAVVLYVSDPRTDLSIDLTVEEAHKLGDQLLRAAGVVERMGEDG